MNRELLRNLAIFAIWRNTRPNGHAQPSQPSPEAGYGTWAAFGAIMFALSAIYWWLFYGFAILAFMGVVWDLFTAGFVIAGCRETYVRNHA